MNWVSRSREFLNEVRAEWKKVTVPPRQEVISTTIVVMIASVIMAIYLWLADLVILAAYQAVIGLFS